MGKMKEEFMRMREKELAEMPLLDLMSQEEFEEAIHQKYGYGLIATMKLGHGETNDDEINTEKL